MPTEDPALQPEVVSDDTATPPPVADEQVESAEPEGDEEQVQGQEPQEDQTDRVELLIEGEEPPPEKEAAPSWVKELRKEHRELKARNAELERTLRAQAQPTAAADPGPKPTLDGCDYDTERFEQELESWRDRKQEFSRKEAEAKAVVEVQQKAWSDKLRAYGQARDELSKQIPTFAEAEAYVQSVLDIPQQGIVVKYAKNAALVICALGQNPKLAQDLANEKDPIELALKVRELEARLKMSKKSAPAPEKPVKGTGPVSGSVDSQLERLRADAAKTGDYSKVLEYKRQKQRQ